MSTKYKPTIGLEIHAELSTQSKMFCGCKNDPHYEKPNFYVCPVCTAQPGSLPVVNEEAVAYVRMVGEALGAELADFTEFDRKNYFYPDIPKAYQISQYAYPLVSGGTLADVTITRIHLEEDTARSQHEHSEGSVVDFNRAGVPLMELVTEPVIHDAETAGRFARELQLLLRVLGVSGANMERGEMRVEANISISDTDEFGTKVEVKNLNSFKSVEAAIAYELKRQQEVLESGGKVLQETRGWDENKGRTFSQRTKETANDYRYFPDPDIPKFSLEKSSKLNKSRIKEIMPKTVISLRNEWTELGIKSDVIETILPDATLRNFMVAVVEHYNSGVVELESRVPVLASNYIATDIAAILTEKTLVLDPAASISFSQLMQLVATDSINSRVAKDLLPEVLESNIDPAAVAEERGLLQLSSEESLLPVIDAVIAANDTAVAEYKAGKENAVKFLVGQVMKETKGSANPTVVHELLIKRIS